MSPTMAVWTVIALLTSGIALPLDPVFVPVALFACAVGVKVSAPNEADAAQDAIVDGLRRDGAERQVLPRS
jgi:hypothetical protein